MPLNQVALMGTVASDIDMTYNANGLAITKFVLSTPAFGEKPPDKHNIVCFGKGSGDDGVAGYCAQYLTKGSRVVIQGRLIGQEFTPQSGKTFINSQVTAFSVEKIGD